MIHQNAKVYTVLSSVILIILPISLKLTFFRFHLKTVAELGELKVFIIQFFSEIDAALTYSCLGSLDSCHRAGRSWRRSYCGFALHHSTPLAHWIPWVSSA
jgi:hypothetical protein